MTSSEIDDAASAERLAGWVDHLRRYTDLVTLLSRERAALDGSWTLKPASGRSRASASCSASRAGSGFPLDPIPRVIALADWAARSGSPAQRVRALNAFVADAYGARRIVAEGVVPARVIETAEHYEPACAASSRRRAVGRHRRARPRARPDGEFLVLEDNLMTPSGFAYAAAAREAVLAALDPPPEARRQLRRAPMLLAGALRRRHPRARAYLVVFTDSPENPAYWEHAWAAARSASRSSAEDLRLDGDRLMHGAHAVDAVYRRANADTLDTDAGRLLGPAVLAGTVGVVNAFGCGVADDKLAHAYVEEMVRFYLGEEPLLRSVPTSTSAGPSSSSARSTVRASSSSSRARAAAGSAW